MQQAEGFREIPRDAVAGQVQPPQRCHCAGILEGSRLPVQLDRFGQVLLYAPAALVAVAQAVQGMAIFRVVLDGKLKQPYRLRVIDRDALSARIKDAQVIAGGRMLLLSRPLIPIGC